MRKKVILPFDDKPLALMYHNVAYPMGIIQANATEDITPWLSSKYINCWFNKSEKNKFMYCFADQWATEDGILIQQQIELCPDEFKAVFQHDIIFQFKKMIDLGFYPHGFCNEEYIPYKAPYQQRYFSHAFMLIGYNQTKKHFIAVGYLADRKFHRYEIPYDCMEMAIATHKSPQKCINFWKYNDNASFKLDYNRLIVELEDYVSSKTSSKIYSDNSIWGMNAIKELGRYIENACIKENYIDYRYTFGVLEHKRFMHTRINYLLEQGYLNDKMYLEYTQKILHLAEICHLLSIKFLANGQQKIATEINDKYSEIIKLEEKYLPSVLSDLKKNKGGF